MKFKNELKRGFSMTVALAMCMGSLHVTALAEEGENPSGNDTPSVSSDTAGADESGADTDTGSNESSSHEQKRETVSDTGRVEGETSTTTERDEEGRVTQEETTKTDSQTIITTDTDITTTTKTEANTEVVLGDREQTGETQQGTSDTLNTDEKNSSETVKDNLQVSFGVSAGQELNNVKDKLQEGVDGVVNKGTIDKAGIVTGLEKDANTLKNNKEAELKEQGYQNGAEGWQKPILDKENKEIGKQTVKVDVVEVKNDKGEIVGYKTVTTTTTTQYGEYNEVEDTTKGEELSYTRPEDPTTSTPGATLDVSFDRNPSSEVVTGTVPEGATAITDNEGNTIGYTVVTTFETTDPDTGVTTTETRNEDVYFQVTKTEVIGKTEKTDEEVFVSKDEIKGTVTETREDSVKVETITEEHILDASQDTLDVTLGMTSVKQVEGDGTEDRNGFTVRLNNPNNPTNEVASWDDKNVLDLVEQVKDQFSENEFSEACMTGANIHVTQNVCDSNGYNGTLELNFKFNKSQLDDGIFSLEVTEGNETKTYKIGKNEMGQFHEGFEDNGNGTQTFKLGNVGSSSNITIRLVGKMTMGDFTIKDKEGKENKIGIDQYFNYETKVKVEIKEAKAEVNTKATEKTEERKDTLTFERDKTIIGTQTETVKTKTEVTTTETVNSWRTDRSSSYTYASEPITPPTPPTTDTTTPTTPGDGPTNNVVVADPDVPLAEIPETEVPLAEIPDMEVPLADAPVEMDIPDEAVPLADVPAEVVITDDAVPLADVPKTGDTSDIWYAAAVLSLGGWMLISGRKREEEDA